MKTVKKVFMLLLSVILVLSFGINSFASDDRETRIFEGTTGPEISKLISEQYDFKVELNYDWFVYGDNTVYYNKLAQLAATACSASYTAENPSESGQTPGNDFDFFEAIGFNDVEYITTKSETGLDPYDNSAYMIGHRSVKRAGKKYEIVIVALLGTINLEDWVSNNDEGADTEAYYSLTGEHPEWLDNQKALHKGFAVSTNRTKASIDNYMGKYLDSSAEKIMYVTGHSRGAAIANILGMMYESDKEHYAKSFTYTFATPATTTVSEEEAAGYKTIFNIINTDDLVPCMPSNAWSGFKRYGKDLKASGSDYKAMYSEIGAGNYIAFNGSEIGELFGTIASSREALYEYDYSDMGYVDRGSFLLQAIANERYKYLVNLFTKDGNLGYVDLKNEKETKNGITQYHVYFYYRPAYFLNKISELLTSDSMITALTKYLNYPISDSYYRILYKLVPGVTNMSVMNDHMIPAYYCLASSDFGYNPAEFFAHNHFFGLRLATSFGDYSIIGVVVGTVIIVAAVVLVVLRKKRVKKTGA